MRIYEYSKIGGVDAFVYWDIRGLGELRVGVYWDVDMLD